MRQLYLQIDAGSEVQGLHEGHDGNVPCRVIEIITDEDNVDETFNRIRQILEAHPEFHNRLMHPNGEDD